MGKEPIAVLHVDAESRWGGGQQQVAYLLEGMHRRGIRTALACQPGSELAAYCNDAEQPHYLVAMRGEFDIIAGARIASLCRTHDFRILHVHSAQALSIGLYAKLLFPRVRLMATRRVAYRIRQNLLSKLKYRTSLLETIVCVSDHIRGNMLRDGIPSDKCLTIHSGIDPHRFHDSIPPEDLLQTFGIPPEHLVIGTIATMTGLKDYPTLLRAAAQVIEERPNVFFCALGDGPNREAIRQMAVELKVDHRFRFAGFQEDVGPFLMSFDIFVLSSRWEGLGTSLLDAQSIGLPVVATSTGGIPEIIDNNRTGLLTPPGNPEALAGALLSLIDNEEERRRLGRAGLKEVERFSIEKTVDENIALYKTILKRG